MELETKEGCCTFLLLVHLTVQDPVGKTARALQSIVSGYLSASVTVEEINVSKGLSEVDPLAWLGWKMFSGSVLVPWRLICSTFFYVPKESRDNIVS
jgi:hypothetical protein